MRRNGKPAQEKKHSKLCECERCVQLKFDLFQERVEAMSDPKPPAAIDCSVPVRAHWRRQHNHMKRQPSLHAVVQQFVKSIIKESK